MSTMEVKAIKAQEAYAILRQNPQLKSKTDEALACILTRAVKGGMIERFSPKKYRVNFYTNTDVYAFAKNYSNSSNNNIKKNESDLFTQDFCGKEFCEKREKDFSFTINVKNNFEF